MSLQQSMNPVPELQIVSTSLTHVLNTFLIRCKRDGCVEYSVEIRLVGGHDLVLVHSSLFNAPFSREVGHAFSDFLRESG